MRFVYVMDPMERILADKDTTFAFQRAAQARGHVALHCLPRDLFLSGGDVCARVREVTVGDAPPHFAAGAEAEVRLADVDAVFIRKDPPFDIPYLYATLMLERARHRTVLFNDPRGLREANEKLYGQHFARHMPKTLVSSNRAQIMLFVVEVGGRAVIKPLYGAGGSGVMLLRTDDKNAPAICETLTQDGQQLAMVQEYLPAVTAGDKRVLLLDGEVLGAINRIAHGSDFRSNIHVGGRVEPCDVTPAELAIIADIAPRLLQDGLFFVGLDFIGGKITEINVTSPTGIQELSRHRGEDVALRVVRWVEGRAHDLRPSLRSIPVL
ncbi:MAG: glutathione synthase [Polyangiaceae bacterium]|jgi:glutathione synthase